MPTRRPTPFVDRANDVGLVKHVRPTLSSRDTPQPASRTGAGSMPTTTPRTNARRRVVDEAARVLELSARHGLTLEYTSDGWKIRDDVPVDFDLTLAAELALTDSDAPVPLKLVG